MDERTLLLPHALILHVNPKSLDENFTKKIERFQTRGGFVEQHWWEELTEMSAEASTGSFMNIKTGLTSLLRRETIAWDRFQDLYDLYRNNGSLYDPQGNIVLQGKVMLLYDRGTYLGTFRSFSRDETDENPFAFNVSWSFKVEKCLYKVPVSSTGFSRENPLRQGTTLEGSAIESPVFRKLSEDEARAKDQADKALRGTADKALAEIDARRKAQEAKTGKVQTARQSEYDDLADPFHNKAELAFADRFDARQKAKDASKGIPVTGGLKPPGR